MIRDKLEAARRRAIEKRIDDFESRVLEVRGLRGELPWEEWRKKAVGLVKEYQHLQDAGLFPAEVQIIPDVWESGPQETKHAPEWPLFQAGRREFNCRRLGGLLVGCPRCRWRNRGCPLLVRFYELFEGPRRGLLVTY